MKFIVNYYGLKLLLLSIFVFLFILFFNFNYFILKDIENLLIFSLILSLISFLIIEDIDFIGYFILFLWPLFLYYYLPYVMPFISFLKKTEFPFNIENILGLFLMLFYIFTITFIAVSVFFIIRFILGKILFKSKIEESQFSKNRKALSKQNLTGSYFIMIILIFLSFFVNKINYYPLQIQNFIYFLFISYILSFFSIQVNRYSAMNLSLLPLIVFSILPYFILRIENIQKFILLISILILISYIIFHFEMKIEIDPETGRPTGSVIDTYPRFLTFLMIFISWLLLSYILKLSISIYSFLYIIFPTLIGAIINDFRKGRISIMEKENEELEEIGVVGGVGLSDGLWLNVFFIIMVYIIYYIILKNFLNFL